MKADAFVLYLARADCPTERELTADIGRRLALPVVQVPVHPRSSVDALLATVDDRLERPDRERIVAIVVNAFIGLSTAEYQGGSRWPRSPADLIAQLDFQAARDPSAGCLLGLQLVWALWARTRVEVPMLVATGDFTIGPDARLALAEAFGDGLACVLEDWRGRWRQFSSRTAWRATA